MESLKNSIDSRMNPRMFDSEPIKRCCLEECIGACCVFGVWIDPREVDDILAHAALIKPYMAEGTRDPGGWFVPVEDKDERSPSGKVLHTAVEPAPWHYGETACIFCQRDGKCSLQMAAMANNLHPWRFKPYYCILHPLDLDEQGRITLDTLEAVLTEKGSCLQAADKNIPLIETFSPELEYLLGEKAFKVVCDLAAQKAKAETEEPNGHSNSSGESI